MLDAVGAMSVFAVKQSVPGPMAWRLPAFSDDL